MSRAVQILLRTYCCSGFFPICPEPNIGQLYLVLLLMKKLFVLMLRQ